MSLNYCEAGGFLVSGNSELPDDPSEYQAEMRRPAIGCSHVACSNCGATVRSQPALFPLALDSARDWAAIYATEDWSALPGMTRDPAYRLYACKCRHEAVNGSRPLVRDEMTMTPWSCAGHPPPTLPITIDGIEITRFTDLERVVREHADRPDSILGELHERLAGTPLENKLADLASRLLVDPDPRARSMALAFYFANPAARGAHRVVELAHGDRSGFSDVPDPRPISGLDLEGRLLRTLVKLWTSGGVATEEVLEPLRRSASRRTTARAVLPVLTERDAQWVREHADEILDSAPNSVGMLLRQRGASDSELIALAKRAGGLSTEEKELVRRDITVNVMGPVQDTLLALFPE